MSRTHDGLFQDRLAQYLPITWEQSTTGPRATIVHEVAGVPEELRAEFSRRRQAILAARTKAIEDFTDRYGRVPTAREQRRLDHQAWTATRQRKEPTSLAHLTNRWRARAAVVLGDTGLGRSRLARKLSGVNAPADFAADWVTQLLTEGAAAERPPQLRAGDLDAAAVATYAARAMAIVQEQRATWTRWNVHSQAAALLQDLRFATAADRHQVTDQVVEAALEGSLLVSAPPLASTPAMLVREDGNSVFETKHGQIYTSHAVLDAEDYLLRRLQNTGADAVPAVDVDQVLATYRQDNLLGDDQAHAVAQICTSGRALDVLVGPAGAGKTTSLRALLQVWEHAHGPGNVIGLAPSAAAASVLGEDLGIHTDNTAKWLYENERNTGRHTELAALREQLHATGSDSPAAAALHTQIQRLETEVTRWELRPGQLLLVDEASLAGTFALQRLAQAAEQAGAKITLIGDPHQLSAVDAGGAFSLMVRELGAGVPHLTQLHRFKHSWEKKASLGLRTGNPAVLRTYARQERIHEGTNTAIIDAAYIAWQRDQTNGLSSLVIAPDHDTVQKLNLRAQADRQATGDVATTGGVVIDTETTIHTGDLIVTGQNNRRLATSASSWVKNGDRWHVTAANSDGSLKVRRETGGPHILLPADYVSEHVDLAYASTAHRAQGSTVETAHAIFTPENASREQVYVAMTRGKAQNHIYVATIDEDDHTTPPDQHPTARAILEGALGRSSAEISAHQAIQNDLEAASSIPRLVAEYLTLTSMINEDTYTTLIKELDLPETTINDVLASESWPALRIALSRADTLGLRPHSALPRLLAAREIESAADVASVLHHRLDRWMDHATRSKPTPTNAYILGLIPRTPNPDDTASTHAALTVAAYRDRHNITTAPGDNPLGDPDTNDWTQRAAHTRATAALSRLNADQPESVDIPATPQATTPQIGL